MEGGFFVFFYLFDAFKQGFGWIQDNGLGQGPAEINAQAVEKVARVPRGGSKYTRKYVVNTSTAQADFQFSDGTLSLFEAVSMTIK